MDVRITARHCQVSASLEELIRERIAKLGRFMSRLHDAQMIVTKEGGQATAELTVGWTRGQQFTARADGETLRVAVVRAGTKIEKQIRRLKARLLRRRAGRSAA